MKFVVFTLGCKVNQYEGQAMIEKLKELGHFATDNLEEADCYILNTCSVTMEADRKSRQMVSRALKLNPNAQIFVCGCSSQNSSLQYLGKPNVRLISGASGKLKSIDLLLEELNCGSVKASGDGISVTSPLPTVYEDDLKPEMTKTRGFIKIQDGCDNFCSYCIVPYLRGRSRSRPLESIMQEAKNAATHTKEIVLSGINISSYGKDSGSSLIELVKELGKIPVRKRIGSLECTVISEDFVKAMLDNGFCNHFHLSMQSGSDGVLKRMNRHYTSKEFIEKVEIIRKLSQNSGITSDIIAGFPEETETEHKETIETIKTVQFSSAHIFPYSERQKTKASRLVQVDKKIRVQRAKELAKVQSSFTTAFIKSQLGKKAEVYIEESDGEFTMGYTPNYIKVYTNSPIKSLLNTTMKEIYKEGVKGEHD